MLDSTSNRFTIPDCDKVILPRIPDFCDIGVSDATMDILENGGGQVEGLKPKNAVTELDLFRLPDFQSNNDIKELILKKIHIDISSSEGRDKIQKLYDGALGFYKGILFREASKEVSSWKFSDEGKIYEFLQKTSYGNRRQTYCTLVKVIFLLAELENTEYLKDLDQKARIAIRDSFIPYMQVENPHFPMREDSTRATISFKNAEGNWKNISFFICFRAKTDISNILKMGYNPEYYAAQSISDAIGLEYEVENEEDAVLIQWYFYDRIVEKDNDDYSLKSKEIGNQGNGIDVPDQDFKDILQKSQDTKKLNSSQRYRDIKSTFRLPVRKDVKREDSQMILTGFEFRGILVDNKNESGLGNHRIYDYFKRIAFMIRMQGYVTENYLKLVINRMFEKNSEMTIDRESILNHFKRSLKTIHIPRSKTVYYVLPERFDTLSHPNAGGLYPSSIKN